MLSKAARGLSVGFCLAWLTGCAGGGGTAGTAGDGGSAVAPLEGRDASGAIAEIEGAGFSQFDQSVFYFDFASNKLKSADFARLEQIADFLQSPAGKLVKVVVEGHTDERGTNTYNVELGRRRAMAVLAQLDPEYAKSKGQGESSARFKVKSHGSQKPADFGHNEDAWRMNRRAVITFPKHYKLTPNSDAGS